MLCNNKHSWTAVRLCWPFLPQRSHERLHQRECWDICRFAEGPVIRAESPGQRTVTQSDDKIHTPEESHHIIELQVKEIPLKEPLRVIVDEDTARRRARRVLGAVKHLKRKKRTLLWYFNELSLMITCVCFSPPGRRSHWHVWCYNLPVRRSVRPPYTPARRTSPDIYTYWVKENPSQTHTHNCT